jgi:hypothetical protein
MILLHPIVVDEIRTIRQVGNGLISLYLYHNPQLHSHYYGATAGFAVILAADCAVVHRSISRSPACQAGRWRAVAGGSLLYIVS